MTTSLFTLLIVPSIILFLNAKDIKSYKVFAVGGVLSASAVVALFLQYYWTAEMLAFAFITLFLTSAFIAVVRRFLLKNSTDLGILATLGLTAFAIAGGAISTFTVEVYGKGFDTAYNAQVSNPDWRESALWMANGNIPVSMALPMPASSEEDKAQMSMLMGRLDDPAFMAAQKVANAIGGAPQAFFNNRSKARLIHTTDDSVVSIAGDWSRFWSRLDLPKDWPTQSRSQQPATPAGFVVTCFFDAEEHVSDIVLPFDYTGIDATRAPDMQPLRDLCRSNRPSTLDKVAAS